MHGCNISGSEQRSLKVYLKMEPIFSQFLTKKAKILVGLLNLNTTAHLEVINKVHSALKALKFKQFLQVNCVFLINYNEL